MKSKVVNIAEAKARLPELIERAANGETIVLARSGKPRARLVPLEEPRRALRVPGGNLLKLAAGWEKQWDAMDAEILAMFAGREK